MKKMSMAVLVVLFVFTGSAFAQDLVGKWVTIGSSWGARDGESDHGDRTGESWSGKGMIMTLEIEKQNGSAFHGKWCSQHKCEDLVGVIKSNGEIRMADHDGYFEASMIGDRMEVCYFEADGKHRIAVCRFMEKE